MNVWLSADTIGYPEGGGHLWAYLNYALGLRSLGCSVTWLEHLDGTRDDARVEDLRGRLAPFGLADTVALWRADGSAVEGTFSLDAADEADLLLNLRYATPAAVVGRFRRAALVDIDPGLLQLWLRRGEIEVPHHDAYFTVGERVEEIDPTRTWLRTRRCVALDWWPARQAPPDGAYTTVTHWSGDEWVDLGRGYEHNDKRTGFLPFLDLPRGVDAPLELAVLLADEERGERDRLEASGWRVRRAEDVARTAAAYGDYIRSSRGELSCAKPSAVRLQNGWISDRTVCYLASGRPAVVQDTGPHACAPDGAGLWRFATPGEAADAVRAIEDDYEAQSALARNLAEEAFDARSVLAGVLERVL